MVAHLERSGNFNQLGQEMLVDLLMDVDALDVHADLAAMYEGEERNLEITSLA